MYERRKGKLRGRKGEKGGNQTKECFQEKGGEVARRECGKSRSARRRTEVAIAGAQ